MPFYVIYSEKDTQEFFNNRISIAKNEVPGTQQIITLLLPCEDWPGGGGGGRGDY